MRDLNIFPANPWTGAKQPSFSTNQQADINKAKQPTTTHETYTPYMKNYWHMHKLKQCLVYKHFTASSQETDEAYPICICRLRLSMVLRLRQHNIGYTADGFYRSDDPTNSVKALKEGG